MAEAFRVDPEALADVLERMGVFQRFAQSLLPEIDSQVTNLHGTWTGLAADAHAEAHRHWTRGAAIMHEALRQLKTAGTTAHANYTGVMATNTSMWS